MPLPSGRRLTSTSPLAEFRFWRIEASKDVRTFGVIAASQFADGWRFGLQRAMRRRP